MVQPINTNQTIQNNTSQTSNNNKGQQQTKLFHLLGCFGPHFCVFGEDRL